MRDPGPRIRPTLTRFRALVLLPVLPLLVFVLWHHFRSGPGTGEIRLVLLISIDTCRADYLGCYGCPRKTTPNIDAFAREATLFEHAISPVPLTLPAHASMLTGTIPPRHGVRDNLSYRLGPSNVTLAEVLRDHGYVTGAVISAFVLDSKFGLDQGFDIYDDDFDGRPVAGMVAERKGQAANRVAVKWLAEHANERAFLFLHYYDPHIRYEPPEPFASEFADDLYAGEIAYTDDCIGHIMKCVKDLGLYESALIIIAGDHGEMLGEHGEQTHSFFVYQSALRVPLLVKLPGRRSPQTVKGVVGLIDIVPTVCSLLGIDPPLASRGSDLFGSLESGGHPDANRQLYCESLTPTKYGANALLGAVSDRWKYVHTTRAELYDLIADPEETRNLAAERPELAAYLRTWLEEVIQAARRSNVSDGVIALSEADRRRLASLGYVGNDGVSDEDEFDPGRDDAKDLIGFHEARGRLGLLVFEKKYDEAKALCERMLVERPDFLHGHIVLAKIATEQGDAAGAVPHLYRALELDPESFDVHYDLGNALASRGRLEDAIRHFRRALVIDPNHANAHCNLGRALRLRGDLVEAAECLREALQLSPGLADAHRNLAGISASQGQLDDAVRHLRQSLDAEPDEAEAHYDLGVVLARQGKLGDAIAEYRRALDLHPDYARAHANLGRALQLQGNADEAITHFREALRILPDSVEMRCALAGALMTSGRLDEALACFREALRLEPDSAESLNGAAWVLAVHPDPGVRDPLEAIHLAGRACELTHSGSAAALDTLAAAYAAAGQFDQAVTTARKALTLADAAQAEELASDIRKRLELYSLGEPYRESLRP